MCNLNKTTHLQSGYRRLEILHIVGGASGGINFFRSLNKLFLPHVQGFAGQTRGTWSENSGVGLSQAIIVMNQPQDYLNAGRNYRFSQDFDLRETWDCE